MWLRPVHVTRAAAAAAAVRRRCSSSSAALGALSQRLRPWSVRVARRWLSTEPQPQQQQQQQQQTQQQTLRQERRREEEALRNAVPGSLRWFALKFNPIYRRLYVVDSTPSLPLWLLLLPSLFVALLWLYAKTQEDERLLRFLERHFRCSLQNVEAGRYHTIVTSMLGAPGDGMAPYAVGTLLPLLAYASNMMRNLGVGPTLTAMMTGHLVVTATLLGLNYMQYRGTQTLQDALHNGDDLYTSTTESSGQHSANMKAEKRKLVFALSREAGTVNIAALERQQQKILNLPDDEFLEIARARYYQREAAAVGAGLSLAVVAARLHPFGMLAVPFAPIPFLAAFAVQAGLSVATLNSYAVPELAASFGGAIMFPFLGVHAVLRSRVMDLPVKEMPEKLMHKLGLSDWTLSARNPQPSPAKSSPADSLSRIFQAGVQLTKDQVEHMRKRNEKFQKRQPPPGTKVSKGPEDPKTPPV